VGGQGSGKSTFWRNYFSDYLRINNDSLNAKKGQKRLKEILSSSKDSVVIDNCSTSVKARREWISIA
jgi:predicted kinase